MARMGAVQLCVTVCRYFSVDEGSLEGRARTLEEGKGFVCVDAFAAFRVPVPI